MENIKEIEDLSTKLSQMKTQAERVEFLAGRMLVVDPNVTVGPPKTIVIGGGGGGRNDSLKQPSKKGADSTIWRLAKQFQVEKQLADHISDNLLRGTILREDPWNGPITVVLCANVDPDLHQRCSNAGTLACANCRLVLYCSSVCQKVHWKRHKLDCKYPLNLKDWAPSWIRENREPVFSVPMASPSAFDLQSGHGAVGLGKSLSECLLSIIYLLTLDNASWGNVPALDLLNLEKNEGLSYQKDLSLCFSASGDLRNVVLTINSIPSRYPGRVSVVINDRDPHIVARNLLIILVLSEIQDEALAADLALHLWYSAFIPAEYDARIFHATAPALQVTEKTSNGIRLDWGDAEGMRIVANLTQETGSILSSYVVPDKVISVNDAATELLGVMFAPHRKDYHDRYHCKLRPAHRIAMREYRSFGLVLPFGAANAHFNTPNKTLFSPGGKWMQNDILYPTAGWNLTEVIAAGKPHGATSQDIFGCLYFYLMEQLREFKKHLGTLKVTFHVTDVDCSELAAKLKTMALASASPSRMEFPLCEMPTKFDRVDVSNTVDDTYVGFEQTLADWEALLNEENASSTLLTCSMNWLWAEPKGRPEQDTSATTRITRQLVGEKKFDHIPADQMVLAWSPAAMIIKDASPAMYDNSKAFENYLKKRKVRESASKIGLRMKQIHTIVPQRHGIPLEAPLNTLPVFSDEEWYQQVCLSRHSFYTRFQEFSFSST